MNTTELTSSGAMLSDCRLWRYSLWRCWDTALKICAFVGLNPSTADEQKNDLTITKCIGFATRWGFGGIVMLNLYAFRATQPKDMVAAADPVGPLNDQAIRVYSNLVDQVVACWGSVEPRYRACLLWQSRIKTVCSHIGKPIQCLGMTIDGSPKHPSRLAYATSLESFWSPSELTKETKSDTV